jgi:hypothetical protein
MTYLDFGPPATPVEVDEAADQQDSARTMAGRLARARWLRP